MAAVVIVSGWAMSAEILSPLAEALESSGHHVTSLSLAEAQGETWDDLYALLDTAINGQKTVLVGWSLGGNLCARYAARNPEKVAALVTMGSTPSYVTADGWTGGKHPDAYKEFADGVAADIQTAMKGFAPVCARGSNDMKGAIRAFRASAKWALGTDTDWRELLDRLAEDARPLWSQVSCPALHFLADSDPLAKSDIATDLQALVPQHKVTVLSGSHGIFLDHTEEVVQAVNSFSREA
ncbi:alpha/beta hydrolase [Sansalvadorimonas sp. 2012CJ34-2]|uniref:Alpha/beta hydrolase n=1 Tax=Parendozoicomonas callyspongiae TaxID=2942213 RepID=A0ABT0PII1_9GAMM|nr:alpha/beta fold hydrolase [Sansalvadorimonas sp. 2012CJ34-2]MCL6271204.1 alpha/beta hydrolase [Sansalvadorimonas sp. 2012CJ34-2]